MSTTRSLYQRVEGFGAAMTDSSAWLIERRSADGDQRAQLMSDVFGPNGLHLSFLRVPIGASDFTVGGRPYSYDDLPPGRSDPELRHFSIAHDDGLHPAGAAGRAGAEPAAADAREPVVAAGLDEGQRLARRRR